MRGWLALLASVSTLTACSKAGLLVDEVDRYADAVAAACASFCRCPANLGFETTQECMSDPEVGTLDEGQKRCMVDAFAQDEEAALAYLECMIPVERGFARCMVESPDCADMIYAMDHCVARYTEDAELCDSLPEDVRYEFMACWSASLRADELLELASMPG